jgi:hypothetical protein
MSCWMERTGAEAATSNAARLARDYREALSAGRVPGGGEPHLGAVRGVQMGELSLGSPFVSGAPPSFVALSDAVYLRVGETP